MFMAHNRLHIIDEHVHDTYALGEQAEAAFRDNKLEDYQTFTQLYGLQLLKGKDTRTRNKGTYRDRARDDAAHFLQ